MTETPAQRRTRLIEQYAGLIIRQTDPKAVWNPAAFIAAASDIADAVIAATPQPEPTRYPSEIETRLIELVDEMREELFAAHEEAALMFDAKIATIKRDLGIY